MKFKYCGLVVVALFVGVLTMPSDFKAAIDENMPEITINVQTPSTKLSFPQNDDAKNAETAENPDKNEKDMEMAPRYLENQQQKLHDSSNNKDNQISGKTEALLSEENRGDGSFLETAASEFHEVKSAAPQIVVTPEELAAIPALELAGNSKPSIAWNAMDNYSLLEDRAPDLTEEEIKEINSDDAIPFNFLKSMDTTEKAIEEEKPKEENGTPILEPKRITPVYITIPIVINSHSNLPISLNIGGQSVPMKAVGKLPEMVKTSEYAPAYPRDTNRRGSNLRTKIFARNGRHEIIAYDVAI